MSLLPVKKSTFTLASLALLLVAYTFSAFIPGAATLFPSLCAAIVGIVTSYLTSHVVAQHISNISPNKDNNAN